MGVADTPDRHGPGLDALQLGLVAALLVLAAGAWALTDGTMQGMDMGPGSDLGSLSFYVGAWVVMMAAMMFPSISPMVRTYALVQRSRHARRGVGAPGAAIAAFVGGYLVTWTIFGIAAFGLFQLLRGLDIEAFSWAEGGPYLAGGVIVAAALYQLTPLKDACLSRCRSPLDFLTERWRDGVGGAILLGLEHGVWCVGCCWALMAALFALGVMSVAWMVFIASLIATEKLFPWKKMANRAIAVLLALVGLAVALAPGSVPGLTLPDDVAVGMESESGTMNQGMEPESGNMNHTKMNED